MPHRNLAVELLQRLLTNEIRIRKRKHLVQSRSFAEMLDKTVKAYQNRSLETAKVIEELVRLAKELRDAARRGEELSLSDDEAAFYEALEVNHSAVKVAGEPTHITLPSLVVAYTNPRNEMYVLVFVSCGLWTRLRRGGTVGRSAQSAAVVTFIADLPVLAVGLVTLSPAVVAAPLLALPYSAVRGAVGGQFGGWIIALRQRFSRA